MLDVSHMSGLDALRRLLARTAPMLAIVAIAAADAGARIGGTQWLFYCMALAVLLSAILVASRRALPRLLWTTEQLGFTRNRDWITYEVDFRGRPKGYIALVIVWFISLVMTGGGAPYLCTVAASGLLLAAWAGDRRKYRVDLPRTDVP
jgi:hypothetical protein